MNSSETKFGKEMKNRITNFLMYCILLISFKVVVDDKHLDSYFFYTIFLIANIFLLSFFWRTKALDKNIEAFAENPLNENVFKECQLIFSEDGIISKGKGVESKYEWNTIVKKQENNNYYYLFIFQYQALTIPKRAIKSQIEKQVLEKLFAEHISFNAEVGHLVKG